LKPPKNGEIAVQTLRVPLFTYTLVKLPCICWTIPLKILQKRGVLGVSSAILPFLGGAPRQNAGHQKMQRSNSVNKVKEFKSMVEQVDMEFLKPKMLLTPKTACTSNCLSNLKSP